MWRAGLSAMAVLAFAPSAWAGPPFLSDDPAPTPYQHYEIYAFGAGTSFGAGVWEGDAGIDFNYGLTPDIQLTAAVPVSFAREDGHTASGLGNVELAAKFRVMHQETSGWDVAVFPRVFLPAGSHLGDDHASLLLPVWVGRGGEDWSTFGGGGCALNRGGDSQDYCIAGWAYTHKIAERWQLGAELFHQTPDVKHGRASTIVGLGSTFDVNENLHLLGYVGAGVQNTRETGRGTAYASILFTF